MIVTGVFSWMFNGILSFFETTHFPTTLVMLGTSIFNSTIGFCTGYLTNYPSYHFAWAWGEMSSLATGDVAIGIANDLFIIFFLVSLIDYATSLRSRPEVEDIFKMFARAILAQFLIFNFSSLVYGLQTLVSKTVNAIAPETDTILSSSWDTSTMTTSLLPTASGVFAWLIWIVNLILALVYTITLVIISFKIVTSFFERYIWFFLAIPFGPPALATIAGTGKFSSTAKAYTRFVIGILVEMVAFAILASLMSYMVNGFTNYIENWVSSTITILGDDWSWVTGYLSNLCLASMIYSVFTKLDSKVEKMYAL